MQASHVMLMEGISTDATSSSGPCSRPSRLPSSPGTLPSHRHHPHRPSLHSEPKLCVHTCCVLYCSYWGEPADAFAAIATGKTPEERQILVTKWYLATLAGQFTRREKETGSEKKPLNPILGEQFLGHYTTGDLVLRAEQVSHHPPITAYRLENQKAGITYEGNCAQKTSFSGRTISVKQVGHGLLRLRLPSGEDETYLITLPKLKIEGICK
jgi:hypothetical protein